MSLINVAPRLTETITVKRATGHTSSGDWTYGTAFTMKARIERETDEGTDAEGRRVNDSTKIITVDPLALGDVVWLPEADVNDPNDCRRVGITKPHRALDGTATHYTSTLA